MQTKRNKLLKQKYEVINLKIRQRIEHEIFKVWSKHSQDEVALEPANLLTIELFLKTVKRKVFKALYNNRTYALVQ